MKLGLLLLIVALSITAQDEQLSRTELDQGVAAYKNAQYAEATAHFKRSLELDPSNANAQIYLATAYFVQWVPGKDEPANRENRENAIKEFKSVLAKDPNNDLALSMLASLFYNSAQAGTPEEKTAALEESARWNQRRIEANPKLAEPYYYLGVIHWATVYTPIQKARKDVAMGATDPGPIPDAGVRASLRSQYGQRLEEGIANLRKCLELDEKNEDAMTYLNLLLRKKADLEDSAAAANADTQQANEWADRAIETRKQKAAAAAPAAEVRTLRMGGAVAEKNVIHKVPPEYPMVAKRAGVQGRVEFTVLIGTDGSIESAQLVSGHPLLVPAAKTAVMQWKYQPFLLNGRAVKMMTDVVITFTLAR